VFFLQELDEKFSYYIYTHSCCDLKYHCRAFFLAGN